MASDWIETFLHTTSNTRSPKIYRLWSGIFCITAALERKVWTSTDVDPPLKPNLYVILVGDPAAGKSIAMGEARKVLTCIPDFKLGPDDPTKASFFDALHAAEKRAINGSGLAMHSPMTMLNREFGVLFKTHDELFTFLTDLYDNPPNFTSPRRTSTSLIIEAPTINMLCCATPAALGLVPTSAMGTGFTSRILIIYGTARTEYRDPFKKNPGNDLGLLQKRITEIYNDIHGEFEWDIDAQEAFKYWFNVEKMAPVPTYGRLIYYNSRRDTMLMKGCMASAVSAGHGLNVTLQDFDRAKAWLLDAEKVMPDAYRAMTDKSDSQLIDDLHHWMYQKWSKVERNLRKPIPRNEVWEFLSHRTPTEKIDRLMHAAEMTGRIKKDGFNHGYTPNALGEGKYEI